VNSAAGAPNLQVAFKEFGFKKIMAQGSIEKHEEAHPQESQEQER